MAKRSGAKVASATAVPDKTPKAAVGLSFAERPLFCFQWADRACKDVWAFKPTAEQAGEMITFMCEMAGLTWQAISQQTVDGHQKHHSQPVASLTRKARNHIRDTKLDDRFGGDIFRFRLGSRKRLWGFRAGRTFHVLWWDPDHRVYPTEPT